MNLNHNQVSKSKQFKLTDGMGTILLAETESAVIPHLFSLLLVLELYKPKKSRNPD